MSATTLDELELSKPRICVIQEDEAKHPFFPPLADMPKCAICMSLPVRPREFQNSKNGQVFCGRCIETSVGAARARGVKPADPVDGRALDSTELSRTGQKASAAENAISQLEIRCPNAWNGCKETFRAAAVADHLKACTHGLPMPVTKDSTPKTTESESTVSGQPASEVSITENKGSVPESKPSEANTTETAAAVPAESTPAQSTIPESLKDLLEPFTLEPKEDPDKEAQAKHGGSLPQTFRTADWTATGTLLNAAAEKKPLEAAELLMVGWCPEGALQYATKAVEANPSDGEALLMRGQIRLELSDSSGAREDFTAAVALDEKQEHLLPRVALASLLRQLGEVAEADKLLESCKSIADLPDQKVHGCLVHLEQAEVDDAHDVCERASLRRGGKNRTNLLYVGKTSEALYRELLTYRVLGHEEHKPKRSAETADDFGLKVLKEVVESYNTVAKMPESDNDARTLCRLGVFYQEWAEYDQTYCRDKKEKKVGAAAGTDQAAADSANEDEVRAICASKGLPPNASVDKQLKCLEDEHKNLLTLGVTDEAEVIANLIEWKMKNSGAANRRVSAKASLKARAELLESSEEYLRKAARIAPHRGEVFRYLGRVQLLQQNWSDAVESLRTAVSLNLTDADARGLFGVAVLSSPKPSAQDKSAALAFLQDWVASLGRSSAELRINKLVADEAVKEAVKAKRKRDSPAGPLKLLPSVFVEDLRRPSNAMYPKAFLLLGKHCVDPAKRILYLRDCCASLMEVASHNQRPGTGAAYNELEGLMYEGLLALAEEVGHPAEECGYALTAAEELLNSTYALLRYWCESAEGMAYSVGGIDLWERCAQLKSHLRPGSAKAHFHLADVLTRKAEHLHRQLAGIAGKGSDTDITQGDVLSAAEAADEAYRRCLALEGKPQGPLAPLPAPSTTNAPLSSGDPVKPVQPNPSPGAGAASGDASVTATVSPSAGAGAGVGSAGRGGGIGGAAARGGPAGRGAVAARGGVTRGAAAGAARGRGVATAAAGRGVAGARGAATATRGRGAPAAGAARGAVAGRGGAVAVGARGGVSGARGAARGAAAPAAGQAGRGAARGRASPVPSSRGGAVARGRGAPAARGAATGRGGATLARGGTTAAAARPSAAPAAATTSVAPAATPAATTTAALKKVVPPSLGVHAGEAVVNEKSMAARLGLGRILRLRIDIINEAAIKAGKEKGDVAALEDALAATMQEVLDSQPDSLDAYIELGGIYEEQGKHSEAVKVYSKFPFEYEKLDGGKYKASFEQMYLHNEIVRIVSKENRFKDKELQPLLVQSMIVTGKVMGIDSLSKQITMFEEKYMFDLLKKVYCGVNDRAEDDPEMKRFFDNRGYV